MNFSEFFNMGGYAFYVWTSYGIALIVLVANLLSPIYLKRKLMTDLASKARRARQQS
ncbi:MAG: heme exporter protein CcmD [Gammaproteobacteria bacterium]